jgi:hypothetical protein
MQFISIKSVLDDVVRFIPPDSFNEMEIIEDCSKAMDKIGYILQYEPAIAFVPIKQYKGCLPKGLVQLNQIAYKTNFAITQDDIVSIRELTSLDVNNYPSDGLPLALLQSSWYRSHWQPLRLSTNTFALSVLCEDCGLLSCPTCEYEYTILPDGHIVTNFVDGYVCVSYMKYPTDCDGEFLIPDNENYKEALKNFALMRQWEIRWNMKEEGSERLYMKYQAQWGLFKAKATADMRITLDSLENVKNIRNRLIVRENSFNRFFGNLNSSEKLNEKGFSTGYLNR